MLRFARVLLLSSLLSTWMGCFGPTGYRVENPAPIAAAGSLEATEQVILEALPKRGWTAENVEPGLITAFLPVRKHLLRVQIKYDEKQVVVGYLDSDNLNEERGKDGTVYAHKKVNAWMTNLARELNAALAAGGAGAISGGSI